MEQQAPGVNPVAYGTAPRPQSPFAWLALLLPCIVVVANVFDSVDRLRPYRLGISIELVTFGGMAVGALLAIAALCDAMFRRRRFLVPILAAISNGTLICIAVLMIAEISRHMAAIGK